MKHTRLLLALGLTVRRHREKALLTQEMFANANDLGLSHYSKIERGQHNLTLMSFFRVADGLGLSPTALLREAERLDVDQALKRPPRPPRVGRPPGRKSRWR
jgi:transcriptional regulator with XRE-family HTH domain